jgi:glutamate/aspartate transport system substrate-binding protein
MMKSGEVAKIYDKWFMQPIPPKGAAEPAHERDAQALLQEPNDKPLEAYAS